MGNSHSQETSLIITGVQLLYKIWVAYQTYNFYKSLHHIVEIQNMQDENRQALDNIPKARQQASLLANQEEALQREREFKDNWYEGERQFFVLYQKVLEAQETKRKCLNIFCREYYNSMQDFSHSCLEQKMNAINLDVSEHRKALQSLYIKKQIKLEEVKLVNKFIQQKLELPLSQFTEEMQDYQEQLRASGLINADRIIQRKPFPWPKTINLFSDLKPIQQPEKEALNDL